MVSKIRVGILGTGFVQETYHMPSFREIDHAEVAAVFGRSGAGTSNFAKRWGIQKSYYGQEGLERICKDPEIDLIDAGLPNFLHLEAITLATENHKAVICEKPLGRNATEAKQMLDAAKRYHVKHCYAENQIFMPKVKHATKLIEQGSIGNITSVRAREAHSGPHRSWFKEKQASGGGVLLDMGSHTIELARHLIRKNPKEICSWVETFTSNANVEDNSLVLVRYENGELGQSENSWTAKGGLDIRFEIYGTEGSIFIDLTRETGMRIFASGSSDPMVEKADAVSGWLFPSIREHETYGFVDELKHFVECTSKDIQPIETFEDGYHVNLLVDLAYEAAISKRWINIPS
jgi:predicted dehydrogenase